MELKELGWNSFFQNHFKQFEDGKNIPARVSSIRKDTYQVFSEKGELRAKILGKIYNRSHSKSDFPVIGDWVVLDFDPSSDFSSISAILPRQSRFSRKVSGSRKRKSSGIIDEQIIAANIDTVFIIMGLDRDFNVRRIERYLTLVFDSGANPVILLNKSDICKDTEDKIIKIESIALGIPIHTLSAKNHVGLDLLLKYLQKGQTVALVGSSGVGKSTLINSLLGEQRQKVENLSQSGRKGQHTTTTREMIFVPSGGMIIDNPGLREIQLSADQDGLKESFKDIEEIAQYCRFNDCQHDEEPNCSVKAAIEDGTIDANRYHNYLKLKQELWYLDQSKNKTSRQLEQAKWGKILKKSKLSLKQMNRLSKNSKK